MSQIRLIEKPKTRSDFEHNKLYYRQKFFSKNTLSKIERDEQILDNAVKQIVGRTERNVAKVLKSQSDGYVFNNGDYLQKRPIKGKERTIEPTMHTVSFSGIGITYESYRFKHIKYVKKQKKNHGDKREETEEDTEEETEEDMEEETEEELNTEDETKEEKIEKPILGVGVGVVDDWEELA
jgi:hypothetical protein